MTASPMATVSRAGVAGCLPLGMRSPFCSFGRAGSLGASRRVASLRMTTCRSSGGKGA
jgi:hypothetical protein